MVIVDTSCLIILERINQLDILQKVFQQVTITDEIKAEYKRTLPSWIHTVPVKNEQYLSLLKRILDPGEASAIALAQEHSNSFLVLDDLAGRKAAAKLKLNHTGTLGVLLIAKEVGHIYSLKAALNELRTTGFRISPALYADVLKKAKEKDI